MCRFSLSDFNLYAIVFLLSSLFQEPNWHPVILVSSINPPWKKPEKKFHPRKLMKVSAIRDQERLQYQPTP